MQHKNKTECLLQFKRYSTKETVEKWFNAYLKD